LKVRKKGGKNGPRGRNICFQGATHQEENGGRIDNAVGERPPHAVRKNSKSLPFKSELSMAFWEKETLAPPSQRGLKVGARRGEGGPKVYCARTSRSRCPGAGGRIAAGVERRVVLSVTPVKKRGSSRVHYHKGGICGGRRRQATPRTSFNANVW